MGYLVIRIMEFYLAYYSLLTLLTKVRNLQRNGNFSLLPAQSAFLEVALRVREEGLWMKMMEGEDNVVMTAVGMLGEAAVRRRIPVAGHSAGLTEDA